jgi:DNA-binding IclR family transcriptional regulator
MFETEQPKYPIESVGRALQLLSAFRTRSRLSLSDVATELSITRSSAHRFLSMFVWHGYATQHRLTKEYMPGPRLLELGLGVLRQVEIVGRARAVIRNLADLYGETVHLAVLNGTQASYIDGIESEKALRVGTRTGLSLPAHATSVGKVLLAQLSVAEVRQRYAAADAFSELTPHTLVTLDQLEADLAEIRERGYAINNQESEPGLVAVAVAVPDPSTFVRSAIAVALPSVRADAKTISGIGRHMVRVIAELTDPALQDVPTAPGSSQDDVDPKAPQRHPRPAPAGPPTVQEVT